MILPVQAALERIPGSLLQASADLRRRATTDLPLCGSAAGYPWYCRRIDFHLLADAGRLYRAAAGRAAGVLYRQHGLLAAGAIGNMPMAAAFTLVPIVLIALYLAFVKRLGAFDAL